METNFSDIITLITLGATFITLVAGIVTIVWFVRDVRRQNSRELKNQSLILLRIEDGQRIGFESLKEGLVTIAKILEKIEGK